MPDADRISVMRSIVLKFIGHLHENAVISGQATPLFLENFPPPVIPGPRKGVRLNDGQAAVLEAAIFAPGDGRHLLVVQAPTGTGKTYLMQNMIYHMIRVDITET